MHLTLKEIFGKNAGIFQMTDCQELSYKFIWDKELVEEYVIENMKVLGLIIGKAIFDRIPINCYFDRTIIRQIIGDPIHL